MRATLAVLATVLLIAGGVVFVVALELDRDTHRRGVPHPVRPFLAAGIAWVLAAMTAVFVGLIWWAIAIPAVAAALALFNAQANYGCNERMRRSYGGWS